MPLCLSWPKGLLQYSSITRLNDFIFLLKLNQEHLPTKIFLIFNFFYCYIHASTYFLAFWFLFIFAVFVAWFLIASFYCLYYYLQAFYSLKYPVARSFLPISALTSAPVLAVKNKAVHNIDSF